MKTKFFDRYTENFAKFRETGEIYTDLEGDEIFGCPICQRCLSRDDIKKWVSVEHVPPKALGGKPRTLTCKLCNNTSGHTLDHSLLRATEHQNFWTGNGSSEMDFILNIDDLKLTGTMFRSNSVLSAMIDNNRSNPQSVDKFFRLLKTTPQPEFTFAFSGANTWQAQISLLRIAHLYAFSVWGYGFVISGSLNLIRKQLLNPYEYVRQNWGIQQYDFPDKYLGVNLVSSPLELQSILVIFDIKRSGRIRRYGVFLPGQRNPKSDLYEWLNNNQKKLLTVSCYHIDESEMDFNIEPYALGKAWHLLGLN